MSSAPPSLPVCAAPPSYAAAVPQTLQSALPDYGPAGTAPTVPGATHFPEAWGYRHYAGLIFGAAFLFLIPGVLLFPSSPAAAVLIFLLGVLFLFWGRRINKNHIHTDLVCDAYAVFVRQAGKQVGTVAPIVLPWRAIAATSCGMATVSQSSQNGTQEYPSFTLQAPGVDPITFDTTRIVNLPAFIELTNRETPQLPYLWVPAKAAAGRPVLAKSGKYVQIAR